MKNILASLTLVLVLTAVPAATFAQEPAVPKTTVETVNTPKTTIVTVKNSDCGSTLCNPLDGVDSIGGLIFKVINFVYSLSYAVIAVFLMISGFKFVKAQGNETELTDAKNTFKYTIIGAILLIGANVITQVIKSLIDSFR